MTGCADKAMLLHALIDSELDAVNSVAIEAHLKTCAGCAAELRRLEQLRDLMTPNVRYAAPPSLHDKIVMGLTEAIMPTPKPQRRVAPWVAGGGLTALAASLLLLVMMPQLSATHLEDQVIDDHVRSLLANHLIDVATSDRHVVKPWFNGKIDFAPPVVDLADQGFPLAGGRLDYLDGKVVPALVYHRRAHSINVFVRPVHDMASPGNVATRRNGYSIVRWSHHGLECWAVSDIDLDELKMFRRDFEARIT